jgi:hypothetical protein
MPESTVLNPMPEATLSPSQGLWIWPLQYSLEVNKTQQPASAVLCDNSAKRLNMELDLQSLFGLHVKNCSTVIG